MAQIDILSYTNVSLWLFTSFAICFMLFSAYNFSAFYLIKFGDLKITTLKYFKFNCVIFFNSIQKLQMNLSHYTNKLQLFENNRLFFTNHRDIRILYFLFGVFSISTCFFFFFINPELAFTDTEFLARGNQLYNTIWINRVLTMFLFIVMPILISGFGSFIKTVSGIKEDIQNHWPKKKRTNLATLFFFGTVHNQAVVDNTTYLEGMACILLIVIFIFSVITWFVFKYLVYGTKLLKILTAEVTHEDGKKKEKDSEITVQFVARNFRWYYQYLLGLDYLNDINKAIVIKNAVEAGNECAECAILKWGTKDNNTFCTLMIPMNKKIKILASSEDERSYKWFIPGLRPITIIKARPGVISTGLLCVKEPGVYRTEFTAVETDLWAPKLTKMVIELKVLTNDEFFIEVNTALVEQMKNESYRMYWYYFKIFAAVAIPAAIATLVLYNNPEIVDSLRNFLSNLFRDTRGPNAPASEERVPERVPENVAEQKAAPRDVGDLNMRRAKDILDFQKKYLKQEARLVKHSTADYTFTPRDNALISLFIGDSDKKNEFYNDTLTLRDTYIKSAKVAFNRLELAYTCRDLTTLNVCCKEAETAFRNFAAADYEFFKATMILEEVAECLKKMKAAAELLKKNEADPE